MKGKPKTRYDFDKETCEYEDSTWCNLPKFKRCGNCLRLQDGRKACGVTSI